MRRTYLVTYDIADDKRRTRVFKTLLGFGDHVQYSVFLCELNETEYVDLRSRLRSIIHHRDDQVLLVDLGPTTHSLTEILEVVGRAYSPPARTFVI